ncbi:hypothetical protein DIZ81_07050 [Legionella taurinensis]|uniref:Uncharacterized protein n=1 Tax=Legionella taurinensis TaxID=70611 RepID=A0A3A5L7X8_9GAMM|nr:hypothetical protein [Legionella taurinensis]MDX1837170.1 hypothetical protein [Legionella taurinensis]PUT40354.1 hypothetical protein DB744_07050 [Legionella taurinensis]PUT41588.1 hypothetical protein DB746_09560 [Legionella taurinensis]PUT44453.1 hypothetical protein DB743_08775 [Legionella taurinensis]PUT48415.1 hypothetical protein DB745_05450 [Legionella taurinensis]
MITAQGLFKPKSNKNSSSYIYAMLDWEKAQTIIANKMDKFSSPWLIRESSVDGLLSITYYDPESKKITHHRLCFNGTLWDHAPSDLDAAKTVAMQCQKVSKDNLSESGGALLATFLSEHGYHAENLIYPPESQATKNKFYTGYDLNTIQYQP